MYPCERESEVLNSDTGYDEDYVRLIELGRG